VGGGGGERRRKRKERGKKGTDLFTTQLQCWGREGGENHRPPVKYLPTNLRGEKGRKKKKERKRRERVAIEKSAVVYINAVIRRQILYRRKKKKGGGKRGGKGEGRGEKDGRLLNCPSSCVSASTHSVEADLQRGKRKKKKGRTNLLPGRL